MRLFLQGLVASSLSFSPAMDSSMSFNCFYNSLIILLLNFDFSNSLIAPHRLPSHMTDVDEFIASHRDAPSDVDSFTPDSKFEEYAHTSHVTFRVLQPAGKL